MEALENVQTHGNTLNQAKRAKTIISLRTNAFFKQKRR